MDRTYCYSANAKFHVITDGRHSAVLIPIADCYAVTQRAISAYDYVRRINILITEVIYPQSCADLCGYRKAISCSSFDDPK